MNVTATSITPIGRCMLGYVVFITSAGPVIKYHCAKALAVLVHQRRIAAKAIFMMYVTCQFT